MRRLWWIVREILRELSGERAYQRHLTQHGATHSPDEWRRFCDEHWAKDSRRARCC